MGAWLLLLGFRDYATWENMLRGLPCLRPSEDAMLEAATPHTTSACGLAGLESLSAERYVASVKA